MRLRISDKLDDSYKNMWHDWFAWRPVKIDDTWVWLETVRRKRFWYSCDLSPDLRPSYEYDFASEI